MASLLGSRYGAPPGHAVVGEAERVCAREEEEGGGAGGRRGVQQEGRCGERAGQGQVRPQADHPRRSVEVIGQQKYTVPKDPQIPHGFTNILNKMSSVDILFFF